MINVKLNFFGLNKKNCIKFLPFFEKTKKNCKKYFHNFASEKWTNNEKTNNYFLSFISNILHCLPKYIECVIYNKNEITIYINKNYLLNFLFFIKNNVNNQFKMLIDITAVDYPSRAYRFEVVYNLLSISYNQRIKIKVCLSETDFLYSVCNLFSSANWWERETYDMFGIFFSNHPDLRKILTDYGFTGHPLRKDFPLSGFVEVKYDDSEKRVIYEPVEITQEFRYFEFTSPWEQIEKN